MRDPIGKKQVKYDKVPSSDVLDEDDQWPLFHGGGGSEASKRHHHRVRRRRLVLAVTMFLLGIVCLMTYGGQSVMGVTHAAAAVVVAASSDRVVNPHPYEYLLNKPDLCDNYRLEAEVATPDGNSTTEEPVVVDTVILVVSAPGNEAIRLAIRRTWGSVIQQRDSYRLAFVMGSPANATLQAQVVDEDREYNDIIQEDFSDTYRNLTLKSVAILRWVDQYCQNSRYVVKIDDDCFLHPVNLRRFLETRHRSAGDVRAAIYGRVWQKVKPIRDVHDKWHVTADEFRADVFPDYTGGPTYVVTTTAVPALYAASLRIRPLVLEDVYVTGLCADKASVARVSDPKFGVADPPSACALRNVISYHRVSADAMYLLWWLANDSRFAAMCDTKDANRCSTATSTFVDLANVIIKNSAVHK